MTLPDCLEITNAQYLDLDNPQFEGQTNVVNNYYWMMWSDKNGYYKTRNQLVPDYILNYKRTIY